MNEALFQAATAAVTLEERTALDTYFALNAREGLGTEEIIHAVEVAEMQLH